MDENKTIEEHVEVEEIDPSVLLTNAKVKEDESDQTYFGHGKLLLSGEYFVLDGAKAIALPTKLGQSLTVRYRQSFSPKLYWKSYGPEGNLWFEACFEFWHFEILGKDPCKSALFVQTLLRQVRKQNNHFLRDNVDVHVEARLQFPLNWGLGSSSSLIYNIAQWAYISPFELLFKTYGGSGYDIACAQANAPIVYEKKSGGPSFAPIDFNPPFAENLYFIYLGRKQDSGQAIKYYQEHSPFESSIIESISEISESMLKCEALDEFENLISSHEDIVATQLSMAPIKDLYFSDYWGEVKSLGAWGGDFALVTSTKSFLETREYFLKKGYNIFIKYTDLVVSNNGGSIGTLH